MPEPLRKILSAFPRYGRRVVGEALNSYLHALRPDSPIATAAMQPGGSLLPQTFNESWAAAVTGYHAGQLDGYAMHHSDVEARAGWLDVLADELDRTGVDVLAVIVPLKDHRGLTSTAVDDTGDPWRPRRLTMTQVHDLPETITDDDVGGELLLNTGLWVCRLGPWCKDVWFQIHTKLIEVEPGKWEARVIPEDWDFSRQCRRLGLKLAATRKVRVVHHGDGFFDNHKVWGWDHDKQNAPIQEEPHVVA